MGSRGSMMARIRDGDGEYLISMVPYVDSTPSGARIPYAEARIAMATAKLPPALSPAMHILSPVEHVSSPYVCDNLRLCFTVC